MGNKQHRGKPAKKKHKPNKIKKFGAKIKAGFKKVGQWFKTTAKKVWGGIKNVTHKVFSAGKSAVTTVYKDVKGLVTGAGKIVQGVTKDVSGVVKSATALPSQLIYVIGGVAILLILNARNVGAGVTPVVQAVRGNYPP